MTRNFNEEYRFGSAAWASEHDVRAGGLLTGAARRSDISNARRYIWKVMRQ